MKMWHKGGQRSTRLSCLAPTSAGGPVCLSPSPLTARRGPASCAHGPLIRSSHNEAPRGSCRTTCQRLCPIPSLCPGLPRHCVRRRSTTPSREQQATTACQLQHDKMSQAGGRIAAGHCCGVCFVHMGQQTHFHFESHTPTPHTHHHTPATQSSSFLRSLEGPLLNRAAC